MRLVITLLALLAVAGCPSGYIRYEPDRQVVRSIPADKAREAIRERLGRAKGVSGVSVAADRFEYTDGGGRHGLAYKATRPAIYSPPPVATPAPGLLLKMPEPPPPEYRVYFSGSPDTDPAEYVSLAEREDAEVIVDALASLGAEVPPPPAAR